MDQLERRQQALAALASVFTHGFYDVLLLVNHVNSIIITPSGRLCRHH